MITANHRAKNLNVPGWYPIMFRPDELSKRPHFFPPFRARPAPAHSSHARQQTREFVTRSLPFLHRRCSRFVFPAWGQVDGSPGSEVDLLVSFLLRTGIRTTRHPTQIALRRPSRNRLQIRVR